MRLAGRDHGGDAVPGLIATFEDRIDLLVGGVHRRDAVRQVDVFVADADAEPLVPVDVDPAQVVVAADLEVLAELIGLRLAPAVRTGTSRDGAVLARVVELGAADLPHERGEARAPHIRIEDEPDLHIGTAPQPVIGGPLTAGVFDDLGVRALADRPLVEPEGQHRDAPLVVELRHVLIAELVHVHGNGRAVHDDAFERVDLVVGQNDDQVDVLALGAVLAVVVQAPAHDPAAEDQLAVVVGADRHLQRDGAVGCTASARRRLAHKGPRQVRRAHGQGRVDDERADCGGGDARGRCRHGRRDAGADRVSRDRPGGCQEGPGNDQKDVEHLRL